MCTQRPFTSGSPLSQSNVNPNLVLLSSNTLLTLTFLKAGAVGPRRLDISYPTTEFTKMVKQWEHFNDSKMGIVVRHIRRLVRNNLSCLADPLRRLYRSGLPDNVFDSGERPPKLVQKRGKVYTILLRSSEVANCQLLNKGAGKSSDISPHKPAKKPRLVHR